MERCGYFSARLLSPLELAFLLYHTAEGTKRTQEAERLKQKERWAMDLLTEHAPEKAREYLLRDENAPPEPEGVDEAQFLNEDPWFSDQRALHERLGMTQEQVGRLLEMKG